MPNKKHNPKNAGRKRKLIDWELVDNMLIAHCKGVEVAAALGIDRQTFYRAVKKDKKVDFDTYQQQKQAIGKELLRRKMFSQAMKDSNTTERIFLSKNLLGYTDKQQQDIKVEGTITLPDITIKARD
jgi:hypothetical protein